MDRRLFLASAGVCSVALTSKANAKNCPEPSDRVNFILYRDGVGEWRWRLFDQNTNLIAESGEGYVDKRDAERGIEIVRSAYAAPIEIQP